MSPCQHDMCQTHGLTTGSPKHPHWKSNDSNVVRIPECAFPVNISVCELCTCNHMSTAALPAFARLIIKQSWNETRLSVQQDSDAYQLAGLRFGMFNHDLNYFVFMSLCSYTCSFKILSFAECIQLALPPDHPWQVVCIPLACLTSSSWTLVRCRRVNTTCAKPTA